MAVKRDKMNAIIQRELSEILQFEVKDPKIGICTITEVEVTNELSYAKIYVSFLNKSTNIKEAMNALDRSKGYIRTLLSKRLTTYKTPNLLFVYDTSLAYGNHINDILQGINKDKKSDD